MVSGIANGTAAVGGMPVVLFFLYGAAAAATSRVTLILLVFLATADLLRAALG